MCNPTEACLVKKTVKSSEQYSIAHIRFVFTYTPTPHSKCSRCVFWQAEEFEKGVIKRGVEHMDSNCWIEA